MKTNKLENNNLNLPEFINKLKQADKKYMILYEGVKILYIIIITSFFVGGLTHLFFNGGNIFSKWMIGNILNVLGMIMVFLYLNYRGKDYKNIDYSQTTYQMLKKTSERYKLFLSKDLWVLPGIACMSIGYSLFFYSEFWQRQLFFWSMALVGGIVGVIYWYFKMRSIKNTADNLIKEMEE